MRIKPLILLGALLPFFPALNISEGFDLSGIRVLVLLWFFLWMVRRAVRREPLIPTQLPVVLLTVFVLLGVLSLFWTNNVEFTLRKGAYLASLLPVAWMVAALPQQKRQHLTAGVLLGATLSAAVAIGVFLLQFLFDAASVVDALAAVSPVLFGEATAEAVGQFPSWYVATASGPLLRAFFPFPNPHTAVLFWGFGVALALAGRRYLFSGVLACAILLSFSRGGAVVLIGVFAAWAVWVLLRRGARGAEKQIRISPGKYTAAVLLAFLLIAVAPLVTERTASLTDLQEGSTSERLELWGNALSVAKTTPLLGVGLGGFAAALDPLASYRVPTNAHNTYLEVLAELGGVGLLLFLGVLASSVWFAVRTNKDDAGLSVAASLGVWVFSIHAVFETNIYSPANLFVLFVLVATAAASFSQEREIIT